MTALRVPRHGKADQMDKVHDAATQLEPVSPLNRELRTDRPYLCIGIRIDGWFQSPSKRHKTLQSSRDLVGMHLQHEDIKGAMDQPRRIELATKPHRHPATEKCVVLRHLVVPFLQGLAPETLELWQDFRNDLGDPLARYYCDYSGFRVKDKSFNPKNQLAAKKHKKHKEYMVLHDTNRLPNGEIGRNREAKNLFFSLAINCFSFLTQNSKSIIQNCRLNHLPVSLNPSSKVNGSIHLP